MKILVTLLIGLIGTPLLGGGVTESVGLVEAYSPNKGISMSTGFFIDSVGHMLTTAHGIDDDVTAITVRTGGDNYPAYVVYKNKNTDVALIEVKMSVMSVPVNISKTKPKRGDGVYALGHPKGFSQPDGKPVRSQGHFFGEKRGEYFLDILAMKGSSGSPIFDENNDVIGILQGMQVIVPNYRVVVFIKSIFVALKGVGL